MNGEPRKFWRQRQKLAACAAGSLLLGACAQLPKADPFPDAPVEAGSPLAAQIAREAAAPGPYPTFEDIPAIPTDVRAPAQWRAAVGELLDERQTLLAETAPSTFALHDTDAFVARTQGDANVQPGDVPTDVEIAESEAFARRLRERAIPPSRPR